MKIGILKQTTKAKELLELEDEREHIELMITLANEKDKLSESKYYIGTQLYDKTLNNGEIWNIIITNEEQNIYGTGWNFISKGTNIKDYGETKYNWLANYDTGEIVEIKNEDYTQLSYNDTLAVAEELALNIDSTNIANDNWDGIKKHGDVSYDSSSKALVFNEDSANNPLGEGGYLELTKNGVDFSNGFTFEFYTNLSRLKYDNGSGHDCFSLFCKIPSLNAKQTQSLKFGQAGMTIGKFYSSSSWKGNGNILTTNSSGEINCPGNIGYSENEDVYITFAYNVYDETKSNEYKQKYYDQYMEENKVDKVYYYINGTLYGYTYYGHDSYELGLSIWNNDTNHFYLGVCPWWEVGNLYYLKGSVYTCRLYTKSLTEEEVLANYNKTTAYRRIVLNDN